jgi:hypothetical protein
MSNTIQLTASLATATLGAALDDAVAAIQSYTFGSSREPLCVVQDLVREAAKGEDKGAAIAVRLADVALAAETTPHARQFVLRQLVRVGGIDEAKRVLLLLLDPATSDDARYFIHAVPGKDVDDLLRGALDSATDEGVRTGIGNTLAVRGVK